MIPTTLQIALPDTADLPAVELARITGRATTRGQLTWLDDHQWPYELDTDGRPIVGRLYAHLRLAGLQAAAVGTPAGDGFNFDKVR